MAPIAMMNARQVAVAKPRRSVVCAANSERKNVAAQILPAFAAAVLFSGAPAFAEGLPYTTTEDLTGEKITAKPSGAPAKLQEKIESAVDAVRISNPTADMRAGLSNPLADKADLASQTPSGRGSVNRPAETPKDQAKDIITETTEGFGKNNPYPYFKDTPRDDIRNGKSVVENIKDAADRLLKSN